MLRRLFFLLRLLAAVAVGIVVWDAVVFRSGLYRRWMEPNSTAGATLGALRVAAKTYEPGRRNVLVLGDSRIGEGFSQRIADAAVSGSDLHFINGAIAGTEPRAWYYLIRELDPYADRYAAIVLMAPYDPADQRWPFADYAADIAYTAPLVRLSDLLTFSGSFDSVDLAARARRAILFPAQPLRGDIESLLAAPRQRIEHLRDFRRNYVPSSLNYPGRGSALPELALDPQSLQPVSWQGVDAENRGAIEPYLAALRTKATPEVLASNERYFRTWLTRIAAPYRDKGAPVLLMQIPRGPWHGANAPAPAAAGAIADLAAAGTLALLPPGSFVELEQPRYFFDSLHMNHAGRERFSALLAQHVAEAMR